MVKCAEPDAVIGDIYILSRLVFGRTAVTLGCVGHPLGFVGSQYWFLISPLLLHPIFVLFL